MTVKNASLSRLEAADFISRAATPARRYYGEALVEAARADARIVCLSADLTAPTETDLFRDQIPERFYNTGIAEANTIGMAGGMARCGDIPFVHSFCAFATKRCYDQITMQVAYPRLPVKIVGFLPGLSTLLGVSHQAIEDLAIMRAVPQMMVLEPSSPAYFAAAVRLALDYDGPVYLRLKRPEKPPPEEVRAMPLSHGRGIVAREGDDVWIVACGLCVGEAMLAAEVLAGEGVGVGVIDMPAIKPLDAELILSKAKAGGAIVVAENHSIVGGLGSAVAEALCDAGLGLPFRRVGVNDEFAEGGSTPYLFRRYGIDADAIAAAARAAIKSKKSGG